jgi:uncharacterized protein
MVDMTGTDRDRDERGRPHNARPRDALGRPLAPGTDGVPGIPDDLDLGPDDTLVEAQRLLDEGLPFQAHEVLEAAWKSAPAGERDLWQGLAQVAVGLTHALRGNPAGARALLARAVERISPYREAPPHGIDVAGLLDWAAHASGNDGAPPAQPRLRRG